MPNRSQIIENLDWITERISNRVWIISVGILGTSFGFLVEASQNSAPFLPVSNIVWPIAIALISMVLDLIQYLAANFQNLELLKKLDAQDEEFAAFHKSSIWYVLRRICFRGKILTAVTAAALLIYFIAREVIF